MNALLAWDKYDLKSGKEGKENFSRVDMAKFITGYNAALNGHQKPFSPDEMVVEGWACAIIDIEAEKEAKSQVVDLENIKARLWDHVAQIAILNKKGEKETAIDRVRKECLEILKSTPSHHRKEIDEYFTECWQNFDLCGKTVDENDVRSVPEELRYYNCKKEQNLYNDKNRLIQIINIKMENLTVEELNKLNYHIGMW